MDVMMRRAILLSLLILLPIGVTISAPAPQQAPSDAAKAMVGKWEFSNADRDKICNVVFRTGPGAVGMKVVVKVDGGEIAAPMGVPF